MDLNTITPADFQTQFRRDFPYLASVTYDNTKLYNTGNEVYYPTTQLFYTALSNGITGVAPNSDPAKWQLTNDSVDNYVQDADIINAFAEAQIVFNQGLFDSDAQVKLGYLYATAHFLCNDLKAAQAGIEGTASFPLSSRSVGSVSEAYAIPESILKSPILAQYTASTYGWKYLALVLPNLVGNVAAVYGGTNP